MDNSLRYRGRVVSLGKNCAFIGKGTVVTLDGATKLPVEYDIYDIFVHKDEFIGEAFAVGMDLTFLVEADDRSKNKNALRAVKVLYAGVDLQFPEQYVDHPTVPVTWCFKPAVLEYMKSRPDRTFALVIGAVMPDAPSRTKVLEMNIGLGAIKNGAAFVSFYAPGDYEVYIYLVEYEYSEKTVRKVYAEVDACRFDPKTEYGRVTIDHGYDLPFIGHGQIAGKVVTVSTLTLSVPDGIFAKPMTGWKLSWFEYFWNNDLLDDCDRRGKQWFAFTLGIPAFVVWELLKRSYFFFWGLWSFLAGYHPGFAWRETTSSYLSADFDEVKYANKSRLMKYDGLTELLRPGVMLFLLGAMIATFLIPKVLITIGFILGVVGLVVLAYLLWRHFSREAEKKAVSKKWEGLEASLLCGVQQENRPVTAKLFWTGIKRTVCRNYRKG